MEKANNKKYNVEKEIRRCGVYRPLRFKDNGKIIMADYDRDKYCEILREEAEDMFSAESKADFEFSFAQSALGLLEDKEYYLKIDNYTEEELKKEKEKIRKKIYRIHNRILEGKEGNANTVASDKTCYHFLKGIEKRIEKRQKGPLLTLIEDDKPFYYENKYLYTLVLQLIETMYSSDIFNYVPSSNNFQRICYGNHLKMIEDNLKEIFGDVSEDDSYSKWVEILEPFKQLIYESSYPGIKNGGIWYYNCKELRYFDCAYEIARNINLNKNFSLYGRVKSNLNFDLGNTREEVAYEIEACEKFFENNQQDEKILFCNIMIDTLKNIVRNEFSLAV